APRNRKTNSIAPLRPALSSADDGTSPPLGRAEALAIRQVAGLVEVRSAQVMNTSGRDSQREIKIRQHLERAGDMRQRGGAKILNSKPSVDICRVAPFNRKLASCASRLANSARRPCTAWSKPLRINSRPDSCCSCSHCFVVGSLARCQLPSMCGATSKETGTPSLSSSLISPAADFRVSSKIDE